MSDPVHINFRKYPDAPHWQFSMYRLGEDEFGIWLFAPSGTSAQKPGHPPVTWKRNALKVVTHDRWWSAIWNDGTEGEALYVDIATPPVWNGETVTMIDLDLDVARDRDGTTSVLDEDEFAEHQVLLEYPEHLIGRARTTTASVFLDVQNRVEPFGDVGDAWLAEGLSRTWPTPQ